MKIFNIKNIPKHWFIIIFGIKIICSILLTTIYIKYYTNRETADIFKYFDDSKFMFNAIYSNPLDFFKMIFAIDYDSNYFTSTYYQQMSHWTRPYSNDLLSDSHVIIRFNAFVRLFSFGYFNIHNVFINFVSLLGLTLIYKSFSPIIKEKERLLFYIVFLIPSVLFWGSGLLKESIIFFGLGLIIYHSFKLLKRPNVSSILYIAIGIVLLAYTKFYLIVILFIPLVGFSINHYFKNIKPIIGYTISIIFFIISINTLPLLNNKLNLVNQIAIKQQAFSRFVEKVPAKSGFSIPELTDGFSIFNSLPNALLNTFIRPYIWECHSLFMWLSSFENIIVLFSVLLAVIFRKKINLIEQKYFYFNLFFVLGLFLLIGLTTPVFGAIVRYKIPGLILLFIAIIITVDIKKIKQSHPLLNKIL